MTRFSHLVIAAFFSAVVGIVALAPARAAGVPAGPAISLDQASKPGAETTQYRGRRGYYRHPGYRRHYGHRRPFYGRPYFAPPVYVNPYPVYRRCWTTPRRIWNGHRYVRRWVRVCR